MNYTVIDNKFNVFGTPDMGAVEQMRTCLSDDRAITGALMGDHHLGYAMPIGGVIGYDSHVSPSGVGYDIACGNKAVRLDASAEDVIANIDTIMDDVFKQISFGVGRENAKHVDHELFESDTWDLIDSLDINIGKCRDLKRLARTQLGTVGSGNHYVDIFVDEQDRVWVGVHFGSRGLGHKLATHFVKAGGGKDGINVEPVLLHEDSELGEQYIKCMELAGQYAYAGRDWVCEKVASIIGANIVEEVHNHHNFAWKETHNGRDLWVVRKGATPARDGQLGFVGGSMGDNSVILSGTDENTSDLTIGSTVHGAGRVMSRTQAAGKKRWKKGKMIVKSEGEISDDMMQSWIREKGVTLRGGGTDESPHCYRRLDEVLETQGKTVRVLNTLTPLGVAMAGADTFDPYKD
jgi:tRNA-splicing ligase RtcB